MITRRQLLLTVPLVVAGCSGQSGEEPLWVGHVSPLSGSERAFGDHARQGILLAIEEVNENREKKDRKLAVLHADSKGGLDQASREAVRLVTLNKVLAVMGGRELATADRLAQSLQPYPTALLTPAAHGPSAGEGVFSLDVTASFRGQSLATFGSEGLKKKKALALVDTENPACTAIAASFAAVWRAGMGQTLQTWDLPSEEKAGKLAGRLGKSDADLLLFAGKADSLVALDKLTLPILFGGEEAEWRRLEQAAGDRAIHAATVHVTGRFDEAGKGFLKKYQERFHEPASPDAWHGYEMTRVLSSALRKAKGTGAIGLREQLNEKDVQFPGLTGNLTFKGGHAVRPLYIVALRGSDAVREFKPE